MYQPLILHAFFLIWQNLLLNLFLCVYEDNGINVRI